MVDLVNIKVKIHKIEYFYINVYNKDYLSYHIVDNINNLWFKKKGNLRRPIMSMPCLLWNLWPLRKEPAKALVLIFS